MAPAAKCSEVVQMPTQRTGGAVPRTHAISPPISFVPPAGELELVAALRRRDESAFSS